MTPKVELYALMSCTSTCAEELDLLVTTLLPVEVLDELLLLASDKVELDDKLELDDSKLLATLELLEEVVVVLPTLLDAS